METACGYLTDDKGRAWFSSDEFKWKNRMAKLAEQYPDQVQITVKPEDNDGCLNAYFPAKWLKITPPIKRNMTEEQRMAAAERMRNMRKQLDDLPFDENNEDYEYEDEEDDDLG